MHLALIHLTDLHIKSEDDPILAQRESLLAAMRSRATEADAILLAVTGDMSFSGEENQLLAAFDLILALQDSLATSLGVPVTVAVTPGNHDCDFTRSGEVRNLLIPTLRPEGNHDPSTIDFMVAPLHSFFEIRDALLSPSQTTSSLVWHYDLSAAGKRVVVTCLNTAWCSTLHETQGKLFFPPATFDGLPRQRADCAITLLHHPTPWMEAQNGRQLTEFLERTADIVLTGHDHVADQRWVGRTTGHTLQYLEGVALQSHDGSPTGFNVLTVDIAAQRQQLWLFQWDDEDGRYVPTDPDPPRTDMQANRARKNRGFEVTDHFQEFLDDLGLEVNHPTVGALSRPQIYCYPYLRRIRHSGPRSDQLIPGEELISHLDPERVVLITGDEESGKTSLAKQLFDDLRHSGVVPVYLRGEGKGKRSLQSVRRLQKSIASAVSEQYGQDHVEVFSQLDSDQRILLIDDYDEFLRVGPIGDNVFEHLLRVFSRIYLLSDSLSQDLRDIEGDERSLGDGDRTIHFRLQPFGYQRRDDMVQRWMSFKQEYGEDPVALARDVEACNRILDTVIGKNLIAAYPVYILGVLQANDSAGVVDLRTSINAHYYELFIKNALALTSDKIEYSVKMSFLAHLAYRMVVSDEKRLSTSVFDDLHENFREMYGLRIGQEQLWRMLRDSRLLVEFEGKCEFKYGYCYYYFAASYLADNVGEEEVREQIERLATEIYEEDNANILLFLAHLSKDSYVLDAMLRCANGMFDHRDEARLDEELDFLKEDVEELRLRFEELGDQKELRQRELERRDRRAAEREAAERQRERQRDYTEGQRYVRQVGAAFKTSQILGQVLKNFPASIPAVRKREIAAAAYGSSVRALADVIALIGHQRIGLVEDLMERYLEEGEVSGQGEALLRARASVAGLTRLVSFGAVRRIVGALGDPRLQGADPSVEQAIEEVGSPASELTLFGLDLDRGGSFPQEALAEMIDSLGGNPIGRGVLQLLVVQHMHLFPMEFKERQRACATLGIEYKPMRVKSLDPRRRLVGVGKTRKGKTRGE